MFKKSQLYIILLIIILGFSIGCAGRGGSSRKVFRGVVTMTGIGAMREPAPEPTGVVEDIDMDWADAEITATGMSAPPADAISQAQARLMARRGAKVEALRNLAEEINGVRINSNTTVRNFLTRNDEVNAWTRTWIQGARVISENQLPDGSWEVTVGLNLQPLGRRYRDTMRPPPVRVPPPGTNVAQQKAMARRAAYLDAQRQLLEYVKGLAIDSRSTVEDFMLRNDRINSSVRGVVRGARVVDTRYLDDGTVEVDIEFDLSNLNSCIR